MSANSFIRTEGYPLPTVQDLFSSLANGFTACLSAIGSRGILPRIANNKYAQRVVSIFETAPVYPPFFKQLYSDGPNTKRTKEHDMLLG